VKVCDFCHRPYGEDFKPFGDSTDVALGRRVELGTLVACVECFHKVRDCFMCASPVLLVCTCHGYSVSGHRTMHRECAKLCQAGVAPAHRAPRRDVGTHTVCRGCGHTMRPDGSPQPFKVNSEEMEGMTLVVAVCTSCGGCPACHERPCQCAPVVPIEALDGR